MQKKTILLALFAILSFLAWRHFTATPPSTPLTPEQQVNALLSQSVIPAKELAEFCEKYPSLVTNAFKRERKSFSITGRISKGITLGVESNNFAIELEGSKNQKVKITSDFNRLLRWVAVSVPSELYKKILIYFHRENRSIILIVIGIDKTTGSRRQLYSKVIFREGENITINSEFRQISPGWVKFDLIEPLPEMKKIFNSLDEG